MPFIRDVAVTELTATTTTTAVANMPVHETNDILLVFQVKDAAAVPTQVGSNYTALQSGTSAGAGGGAWWRRATTSAEPAWESSWTADSSVMVVISIGGAHTTNAPTSVRNAADGTTIPYSTTGTLNTPSNNCLVIAGWLADNSQGPTAWPTHLQALYSGDSGEAGLGVGWAFFPTSGTSTTGKQFYAATADDGRGITVCIEDNGSNSTVQAYVDSTSTAPTFLTPLSGATLAVGTPSWSIPVSVTRPLLGYDFSIAWNWDGAASYTNITTALNNTTTADVTAQNTVGGCTFFGYGSVWRQMALVISTGASAGSVVVWEYWNGSAWATLSSFTTWTSTDRTFNNAGTRVYRWTPPSNWATTSVNGTSAYYIRRRVTTAASPNAPVLSQGTVNGMGCVYDAVTAVADAGANPYHAANGITGPTTVPDLYNQAGNEVLSSTAIDMDPGYILTMFKYTAARDGIDCGLFRDHKGVTVALFDTSNNYRAWTVSAKDATDSNYFDKIVIGIQPAQTTATTWGAQNVSGSFNASVIDTLFLGASSAYAGVSGYFSQLLLVNGVTIVSGGTSAAPIGFNDITNALVNGCGLFPVVAPAGKAASFYVPLQMGGANAANISCSLNTFQFPTQASEAARTGTWHVDDGIIGIEFYGKTGELRKFLSCTFVSDSAYYWRFNASHSASSTTDFTGSTVVKANVTLRSTVTLDSVAFVNCPTFTQNSAVLTNCTFNNSKVTSATLGDMDNISGSAFISSGTGHAIEVSGSATNITFSNNTFTGYASADGSTGNEAVYVNIASGTVNIYATTDFSVRTAGATVNVIAGAVDVNVTVTDVNGSPIQNALVFVKAANATGPMPYDVTVTITNSGTTATVSHTAHNMETNDKAVITGASHNQNNGIFQITKIDANSYSYVMASAPGSDPSGTIKATYVAVSGLTDVNGKPTTVTRVFASNQPVTGWARKSSGVPYYKQGPINGTISSTTGAALSASLISDD